MTITTIVPAAGNVMHYIGKPVKDYNGKRIGSIIDAIADGDHYTLIMEVDMKKEDFER